MIKIPEIDITLLYALGELDKWLGKNNRTLYLEIIGATALSLHHVEIDRPTIDIDLANEISDSEVLSKIEEIGNFHGLGDTWLETPLNIKLPKFVKFTEHKLFRPYKNMTVKVADLKTLLVLKISAYFDRKDDQITDLEDIKCILDYGIQLTEEVIEEATIDIQNSKLYSEQRLKDVLEDLNKLSQSN